MYTASLLRRECVYIRRDEQDHSNHTHDDETFVAKVPDRLVSQNDENVLVQGRSARTCKANHFVSNLVALEA